MKSKITIAGNKKDGYVLAVYNKQEDYFDDISLKLEEIPDVIKLLDKTLK